MHRKKTIVPFLSVIIPVFNESERIEKLTSLFKYLHGQKFSSEVIVVNDGSQDDTLKKLKSFDYPIQLISYRKNKGKGYAIKRGVAVAKGKYFLFCDIDASTPISEFKKMLPYLAKNQVVIGSRKTKGAQILTHQSTLRENLGKLFTGLSRFVLQVDVSDFTCGFKCFSARAGKIIFTQSRINRWSFDAEVLFIATKMGYQIKEIPVRWKNDPQTKVKFPQDIIHSLWELFQIRQNYLGGKYRGIITRKHAKN